MPMPKPDRVVKLVNIYLDRYESVSKTAPKEPMNAAEVYDSWFNGIFRVSLESLLVIKGGQWTAAKEAAGIIRQAGLVVSSGASEILGLVVSDWVTENYPKFWRRGLDLWSLNMEIAGKNPPRSIVITPAEIDQATLLATTEIATMQDHIIRHRRHIERMVGAGIARRWTTERFMQACTCPDGHIIGYSYGNSRYSWYEHMRRMVVGRSRMIAQSANEFRHFNESRRDA
jgi:hypothetical protein